MKKRIKRDAIKASTQTFRGRQIYFTFVNEERMKIRNKKVTNYRRTSHTQDGLGRLGSPATEPNIGHKNQIGKKKQIYLQIRWHE